MAPQVQTLPPQAANRRPENDSSEAPEALRRVMLARALPAVVESLRSDGHIVQEDAAAALRRGLAPSPTTADAAGAPSPVTAERPYAAGHRLLALTVSAPLAEAVAGLARAYFRNDTAAAAGWLLARGTGLRLALPAAARPAPIAARPMPEPAARRSQSSAHAPAALLSDPHASSARAIAPLPQTPLTQPQRRATKRPSQADVDAPNGDELRERREAIGLSQKEVAAAAGLSRGLVAEVERGRRANALTRLRISETLTALERAA